MNPRRIYTARAVRGAATLIGAATIAAGAMAATTAAHPAKTAHTAAGGLATGEVSLKVLAPRAGEVVTGESLPIHVIARGYKLNAYLAGTKILSTIGHYHEILDGKLIDMTPLSNPTHDTISMVGVAPGPHTLTLVPARNDHSMVMTRAVNIPFTYQGPYRPEPAGYTGTGVPAIEVTSPKAGATVRGRSFTMHAAVNNFVLCGECFGKELVGGEGHWHIFVDKAEMPHMLTMAGSETQTVPIEGVKPGRHTFWAVLVDNHHMPIMPMTATSVTLDVKR